MSGALDALSSSSVSRRPSASSNRANSPSTNYYAPNQPLPPIPINHQSHSTRPSASSSASAATVTPVAANPSPRHHPRQLSNSYRTFVSTTGDFDSPRIPYLQQHQIEDSPTLRADDGGMARDTDDDDSRSAGDNGTTESSVAGPASSTSALGLPGLPVSGSGFAGGSLHHHQSQSRRTSANTNGSQAQDPRVLQHHPSHHGSLKNMNSQSSLAGMPTARSNKQRDPGERVISRTTSRQTSGQGVPPSKASATGDPKENGAAATSNGTSAAADPTSTSAVPDRTGQPTPKPSPSQGGAQSKSSKSHPQTTSRAKFRHTPHLPQYEAERVSAAMMHWSKAPVHGTLPTRSMRAHTVTMVDNIAWIFGGCDERGCWRDVWCFDIGTCTSVIGVARRCKMLIFGDSISQRRSNGHTPKCVERCLHHVEPIRPLS